MLFHRRNKQSLCKFRANEMVLNQSKFPGQSGLHIAFVIFEVENSYNQKKTEINFFSSQVKFCYLLGESTTFLKNLDKIFIYFYIY